MKKSFKYFIISSPDGSALYRSENKVTTWVDLIPITDYVKDEKDEDVLIHPATFWEIVKYLFTGK